MLSNAEPVIDLAKLAQLFATAAHAGHEDKAGKPYILHPARVAARVAEYGPDFAAVAWLHDVLEDCGVTASDLVEHGFPKDVVDGVDSVTKRPDETHTQAVTRAAKNEYGLVVKAADVADNSDPARLALLSDELQSRLRVKYRDARALLDELSAPQFD